MADKVTYAIRLTPYEEATTDVDLDTYIIATEVQETLGCTSQAIDLATNFGSMTNTTHGFASGAAYYLSAPAATGGVVLPTLAACDVLYLENTGFQQSSASGTKGTTVNVTDYLTVEVGDNGTKLAILKAGEGIILPMRGTTNANVFYISSTAVNGVSAGGNTLGCKFLSLT